MLAESSSSKPPRMYFATLLPLWRKWIMLLESSPGEFSRVYLLYRQQGCCAGTANTRRDCQKYQNCQKAKESPKWTPWADASVSKIEPHSVLRARMGSMPAAFLAGITLAKRALNARTAMAMTRISGAKLLTPKS